MFFLVGISSKVRDLGTADGACPVCSGGTLHICHKYMTPHVFFIPTFRFGSEYIATCGHCASVMALRRETGDAVRKGQAVQLAPQDLQVLQNNAVPHCPHCGSRGQQGARFCSACGKEL